MNRNTILFIIMTLGWIINYSVSTNIFITLIGSSMLLVFVGYYKSKH